MSLNGLPRTGGSDQLTAGIEGVAVRRVAVEVDPVGYIILIDDDEVAVRQPRD